MKAQFIYEKFREDSDPVHDLGIGELFKFWGEKFEEKGHQTGVEGSLMYFGDKIHHEESYAIYLILKEIVYKKLTTREEITKVVKYVIKDRKIRGWRIDEKVLYKALKKHLYIDMYKKSQVNEKFTQDTDPIHDMSIGIDSKKFEKLNLFNRYTNISRAESKHLMDFFGTSKNNIFYLKTSTDYQEHTGIIQKMLKDKKTKLIIEDKFKDSIGGNQIFRGYETPIGKISTTEGRDRSYVWYVGDLSVMAFLYNKFREKIFYMI